MPILVKLTLFASGDPIMVNISKIQTITPMKDYGGCTMVFNDARKISVRETIEQIWAMVRDFIVNL